METFCQYTITSLLFSLKSVQFLLFQGNYFLYLLFVYFCNTNLFCSQHVNITKCRNYDFIPKALQNLSFLTGLNIDDITYVVDNISSTGDLKKQVDIGEFLSNNKEIIAHFNPETFPGCYLKYKSVTIGLFSSGKAIFVGARDLSSIYESYNWLNEKCQVVNT